MPVQPPFTTARPLAIATHWAAALCVFAGMSAPALAANLAFNKPATGSASCNTNETPAKAVNGSVAGGNSDKFCSAASSRWLQVDLGSMQAIGSFVVKHAGAGGESTSLNTKAFNIQTSSDGSSWTTQTNVSNNTLSTTTHTVTSVSARHVRLNVTTPTQTTDSVTRIYELEVHSAGGNASPTANFRFIASNFIGNFTDTSTDRDGSIVSRSWNFGDGTTSTATNPSHTYASAGSYNVTLTVTDNGGATNTATQAVTISGNALGNNVPVSGLSAAAGQSLNYTMVVPAGASNLIFTISGGIGEAELYTKLNAAPTDSSYDCRPHVPGNSETCFYATPSAGTYHIRIKADSAFSGVSFRGSYLTAVPIIAQVLDQAPQFGVYRSTEPTTYTPPAGVLMWGKGTEHVRKLTVAEKAAIGDDVALRITYHAQCDPYDRFASVFYISTALGVAPTATTPRTTLVDFISPFSDMWQGVKATRVYPDVPINAFASALSNPNRDVWVGISGGSNPQYGEDSCEKHRPPVTDPAIAEVGFKYSLALVGRAPLSAGLDREVVTFLSRTEQTKDTIDTASVAHSGDHNTGVLMVSIAGYGASSGGQEYTNTTITVKSGAQTLASFSTAIDCATYEQYSPRGNPGLFRNNTTSNPRSWCPGAVVPTRFFDLGTLPANLQYTLKVGNPSPWTADSLYRTSINVLKK